MRCLRIRSRCAHLWRRLMHFHYHLFMCMGSRETCHSPRQRLQRCQRIGSQCAPCMVPDAVALLFYCVHKTSVRHVIHLDSACSAACVLRGAKGVSVMWTGQNMRVGGLVSCSKPKLTGTCRYTWEIYAERLMTLSRVYRWADLPQRCGAL